MKSSSTRIVARVLARLVGEAIVLLAIGFPVVACVFAVRAVAAVEPAMAALLSAFGLVLPLLLATVSARSEEGPYWRSLLRPIHRLALWGSSTFPATVVCVAVGAVLTSAFWALGPGSIKKYSFACANQTSISYAVWGQERLQACSGILSVWIPLANVWFDARHRVELSFRCNGGGETLPAYPPTSRPSQPADPQRSSRDEWLCPNERCPSDMVYVPGGWQSDSGGIKAFCLDRYEVTVSDFSERNIYDPMEGTSSDWPGSSPDGVKNRTKFCNGGKDLMANHPINCVDFPTATAYCTALGRRLPTSLEWWWAAVGADGQERSPYPWGEGEPKTHACVHHPKGTCPVGSYPNGQSEQGILDLVGNVWEWTHNSNNKAQSSVVGGAWGDSDFSYEITRDGTTYSVLVPRRPSPEFSPWFNPSIRSNILGFRCASAPK